MKLRNKLLVLAAIVTAVASGSAAAAVKAEEMHAAMNSLRLALVKIGVANAIMSDPEPPTSNAEAHVAAPDKLGSREIQSIVVEAGGVINVHLTSEVGMTGGIVQLVPMLQTGKQGRRGVVFTCFSPNIPDIASAVPDCTYNGPDH